MKKLFSLLLVIAAVLSAPLSVSAYSDEMNQLARLLNEAGSADGMSVSYDGNSLIFDIPSNIFSEEEAEMLGSCDDIQMFAPLLKESLVESMGADGATMLAALLIQFDTDMLVRIKLPSGVKTIRLTGNDFLN